MRYAEIALIAGVYIVVASAFVAGLCAVTYKVFDWLMGHRRGER